MEIWLKETAARRVTDQPSHRPAISKGVIRTHQSYSPSKLLLIQTKILTALKCDNCQKTGHTRNNCYLLKQNFPRTQYRKIPPPRVNSTEVTNEPTDWNDIMEQEETEDYESTTPQENCNTFDVNSQECQTLPGRLLLDTGVGVNLKEEYCETCYTLKKPRKIKLGRRR